MKPLISILCTFIFALSTSTGCNSQSPKGDRELFLPPSTIRLPEGSRPNDLEIADLNGDGAPDVIAACTGRSAVCVLLGDGRGGFAPAPGSPFTANTDAHLVAVGNLNSDRFLDIAITSHDSNAVYILAGNGKGEFAAMRGSPFTAFPDGKPHNHGLALGDLNGDGKTDITLGHQDRGAIAVLLADGAGGFRPAARSPVKLGRGFYPHTLGDLNGDGKLDIVIPDILGSSLVIATGDGKGSFAPTANSPLRVKERPFFVLLADLNGDRRLDIAATHDDISDFDVLLGDGKGNFSAVRGSPFDSGRLGWKLLSADFDGDDKKDLLAGGRGGFTILSGNGAGAFNANAGSSVPIPGGVWGVASADLNKDGKPDVVVSVADRGELLVFLHR